MGPEGQAESGKLEEQEEQEEQGKKKKIKKFKLYNYTIDHYYYQIKILLTYQKYIKNFQLIKSKIVKINNLTIEKQAELYQQIQLNEYKIELLLEHYDVVAAILSAINIELANHINWNDLLSYVNDLKESQNILALCIDQLHLKNNSITILLSKNLIHLKYHEHEIKNEPSLKPIKIQLNLSLNVYQNINLLYQQKIKK